jgi:hypothetical protein
LDSMVVEKRNSGSCTPAPYSINVQPPNNPVCESNNASCQSECKNGNHKKNMKKMN